MMFSSKSLSETLEKFPTPRRYCVAYSGGMDSHVLLHALCNGKPLLAVPVVAVHVDHGLHKDSTAWSEHCAEQCSLLGVELAVLVVHATHGKGQSPEAAARDARYRALDKWLLEGDCLLTAHHQDDQAETVLLQLLRGSGVHGLAAMPLWAKLRNVLHARPLLSFSRRTLQQYAQTHKLHWIDDPSNLEAGYDRNYLRHEIMPALRQRRPAASQALARVASTQAEAAVLLDELARADLALVRTEYPHVLHVSALLRLDHRHRNNVLRYWLHSQNVLRPSQVVLARVDSEVLNARWDASPCITWQGAEVRRYRDYIFVHPPRPEHDAGKHFQWHVHQSLAIHSAGGVLRAESVTEGGLQLVLCEDGIVVRFRHGGERCRPVGRRHHHKLKHLFQERGIPPWERDRIPLLYIGEELVAVADLWVCEPFQASPGESGIKIQWQRL